MSKLVVEIEGKINEGDILVFRNNKFIAIKVKELLPEIKTLREILYENTEAIEKLEKKIYGLEIKVKELRGEE